jgi:hypothetical protein
MDGVLQTTVDHAADIFRGEFPAVSPSNASEIRNPCLDVRRDRPIATRARAMTARAQAHIQLLPREFLDARFRRIHRHARWERKRHSQDPHVSHSALRRSVFVVLATPSKNITHIG